MKPDSIRILDYPASIMSAYAIESLAAEATLAEKRLSTKGKNALARPAKTD